MKLFAFLLLSTFILTSCDQPVRTRIPGGDSYNEDITNPGAVNTGGGTTTTGTGNTNTVPDPNSEPGFDHCPYLSPTHDGGSIGYFGLCQNQDISKDFKAVFSESASGQGQNGTCFIPIHILSSGNSYKLGKAECVQNQPDLNYFMSLNKEAVPPNFSVPRPEAINGVMVIKSTSVNAYMGCMSAKEDFFVATNGCCFQQVYNPTTAKYNCLQPNQQCESAANNYANNVCGMFVQNHSNNYRQVNF